MIEVEDLLSSQANTNLGTPHLPAFFAERFAAARIAKLKGYAKFAQFQVRFSNPRDVPQVF
jgi:hypothetical protein